MPPPGRCSWPERATELAVSLARSPETSGQEFRSSRQICSFLKDAGLRLTRGLPELPTAFLAEAGNYYGTRVCIIVEFDALRGLGHACGHNINAAMAALAGAMLTPVARAGDGYLLLAGTPNEEIRGAKTLMIEQGVFRKTELALLIHAGAWKSHLRYRTSAFRSLLISGESDELAVRKALKLLRNELSPGETASLRRPPGGNSLRLDILTRTAEGRTRLFERASSLLQLQGIRFTPDAGEEPLEPFLANEPAAKRLAAIWQEMKIPFDDSPIWLGSSDMGNLSRCCPTHQSILAVTNRPTTWHTTTFADIAGGPDLSHAIFAGALSLAKLTLHFWQNSTFRRETAEAFLAGKTCRKSS